MDNPQFYIVAGPNGAGKSTYGHHFVPENTPIFNGDLVFADLIKSYPHIEPERLSGGVAVALEKERDRALENKANFAFESNYSSQMAVDISVKFRHAGYETTLVYFGLEDLFECVSRVGDRVKLGGHNIPDETILFNLEEGIKMVNANLYLYDRVSFMRTGNASAEVIASYDKKSATLFLSSNPPQWFVEHFSQKLSTLYERQKLKLSPKQKDDSENKGKRPRL